MLDKQRKEEREEEKEDGEPRRARPTGFGSIPTTREAVLPGSHGQLMHRARRLSYLALDHDVDAFHDELTRLREVLTVHVKAERGMLDGLTPAVGRVVASGQQALVDLVDDVLRDHETSQDQCACLRRSNELTSLLARQARLESDVLADR